MPLPPTPTGVSEVRKPTPAQPPTLEPLLPAEWEIPADFQSRLGDDAGRQRLMEFDGHLLLVLHHPPLPGDDTRRGSLCWRAPHGEWKPGPSEGQSHPVGALIAEYNREAADIDALHARARTATDYFAILTRLTPLVRSARNFYEAVHQARKAARDDRALMLERDRAYAMARQIELLQQDAKNTLDYVIARRSEQQAKAAHRLNILVALFFPLATLTSIFGMELRHGLEPFDNSAMPLPMLALIGAGLALGIGLAAFVARK